MRKYLFTQFDTSNSIVVRASQKVKIANVLARVSIPGEKHETLRDLYGTSFRRRGKNDCYWRVSLLQ